MPFAQQQEQPRVDVVEAMREFSNFQGKECGFFSSSREPQRGGCPNPL